MAYFSKQYIQISKRKDFHPDFDIEDIFNSLEKGFYKFIVCEGFGFGALGIDNDGNRLVYLGNSDTGEEKWVDYYTFIDDFKQNYRTIKQKTYVDQN